MQNSETNIDLENSKVASGAQAPSSRMQRKKYLKKVGKSLWGKSKASKENALSIEVSTKSSEGFSSTGFLASKSSSVSQFFIMNFHIISFQN